MKKIWLGGSAYKLTEEQFDSMNQYLKSQLIAPYGTGNRSVTESEKVVLDWIAGQDIKAVRTALSPATMFVALCGVVAYLIDYFFPGSDSYSQASILVAALTTGAGVNTVTPNQAQIESDILIGDIDTAMPLQGLKVNVNGDVTIDIQGSTPLVSVLSKLSQLITGTVIGLLLKIATGRIFTPSAQITFTNGGATTPAIYWNSQRGGMAAGANNGKKVRARTATINPNTSQVFNSGDFGYMAITNPANVNSIDYTFTDGATQQNMLIVEADALFAKNNETEANGRLDALVTCIDNTKRNTQTDIMQIRINVGATAVTVMLVTVDM